MSKYRKALVAVAAVFVVLGKVLSDGAVSGDELGVIIGAVVTAGGVYLTPNKA